MPTDDYLEVNRANWDDRAAAHVASADYALDRFLAEPDFRSDVVRFDEERLGPVGRLRGVHLQCHIGTDTVSLARLGASMTGVDLSPASVAHARDLAERTGADARFVVADVYSAPQALGGATFDLVYTGVGALCWLPSVDRWASTVAALLAPGGRLFMREGHPVLWAVDNARTDDVVIGFPYFETPDPVVWDDTSTYVETDVEITHGRTMDWNHGLGEIVGALLRHGLVLTALEEHRSVPWNALPGRMDRDEHGEHRLREHPERLPLSYTLQAVRPA
ncbi:class I SAM-dependent methyltransferase [Phycicoccus sp. BSK3Z-2]|uniref:Class I SAM-dependent methyltransferase n=1 Tax=Phycicoccus avicenniae TaxID=2828860 RepID=A0A941D8A3_9MICO|nr:class I SAM-dependent methyltransferase [Phycicoccus avicenniae]MBR7743668.1 class I SAM-dependent methyltransferase [Phycicoccus avicenniae]